MCAKLGIFNPKQSDTKLILDFLKYLEDKQLDFTNTFRQLPLQLENQEPIIQSIKNRLKNQKDSITQAKSLMNKNNPNRIPRNHQVEHVIQENIKNNNTPLNQILESIKTPYENNAEFKKYTNCPTQEEEVTQTFCGT